MSCVQSLRATTHGLLLHNAQKAAFKSAIQKFVADLKRGQLRAGLRVKLIQGTSGVYEIAWRLMAALHLNLGRR